MSKYQAMKEAIEAFQPGGANEPILYSTTEVNEKGFKALLGRKVKARPTSVAIWVISILIILMALLAAAAIATGHTGTPTFAAFVPLFVFLFLFRTTLIAVGDNGLDFYFVEHKRGSIYVAYDKISLPYDRITNVKVRKGRFNTSFAFEFSNEGKSYKIKTSVPNKMKKVNEQAENLKRLLEILEKAS